MQATINSEDKGRVTGLLFAEFFVEAHVVAQVSSAQVFHGEIEVLAVLEAGAGVDYEGVDELVQELLFVHDATDAFLGDDSEWADIYLALDISFMA